MQFSRKLISLIAATASFGLFAGPRAEATPPHWCVGLDACEVEYAHEDGGGIAVIDDGGCVGRGRVISPSGNIADCPGPFPANFSGESGTYRCEFDIVGACYHDPRSALEAYEALEPYTRPDGPPSAFDIGPLPIPPLLIGSGGAGEVCEHRGTSMTYTNELDMPLATFGLSWDWCFDGEAVTAFEPAPICETHFTGYRCAPPEETFESSETTDWLHYYAEGHIIYCLNILVVAYCDEEAERTPYVDLELNGDGTFTCLQGDEYSGGYCQDES